MWPVETCRCAGVGHDWSKDSFLSACQASFGGLSTYSLISATFPFTKMLRVSEGQSVFHLLPGGLGLWNKEQEQQRICANSLFTGAAAQWAELKRDEHGEGRSAARAELGDSTFLRVRKIKSWNWPLNVKPCRKSWTFNYSHEAAWVTSLMAFHVFQWWNEEWLAFISIIQKSFIGCPPPNRYATPHWTDADLEAEKTCWSS